MMSRENMATSKRITSAVLGILILTAGICLFAACSSNSITDGDEDQSEKELEPEASPCNASFVDCSPGTCEAKNGVAICKCPDGFETTKRIRSMELSGELKQKTPIVAVTAKIMKGDKENCLKSGMDDFIEKPVKIERLNTVIKKYVD